MEKIVNHSYIFTTILFTVYSQLIMRWRVEIAGPTPDNLSGKLHYIAELLLNPWVISALVSTFCAGISWMMAMTRFEISYAFPFVSLNYVLILVLSVLLFNETITISKLIGSALVMAGIFVIAMGSR